MTNHLHYFDPAPSEVRERSTDLCIYGATSGGVIAAIEAARQGLRVILLEPSRHVGGMTAGGLSRTDIGSKRVVGAIGGLSREFYRRVGRYYGVDTEWYFEPHVAEQVLEEWLAETGIEVLRQEFIESAVMENRRIQAVRTVSGLVVRARMFMDASYEADLMARAGVSYCVGRESNEAYGETFNGMQIRDNRIDYPLDPYQTPGVPASGPLPGIELGDDYRPGSGDGRIQAYNFRTCLTRREDIRRPFQKPPGYDPAAYTLLARYLDTGWQDVFHSFCPIRQDKVDMNNQGPISTDFIGRNHAYPEAGYDTRERLFQEHVTYQQGLMWFFANDARVPESIREAMREWGLAGDEFTDTGHWPHALYVRESRRMISDCVMTERHCLRDQLVEDSVGLAAHGMDSHTCRRILRGATLFNEGDVQVHCLEPYPVSYRALVPRASECQNLLVTFCLSATHIAFGSIRMEPVLMVLSQSAALAAAIALEEGCPVQDVTYSTLQRELLQAGQVLDWAGESSRLNSTPPTTCNQSSYVSTPC